MREWSAITYIVNNMFKNSKLVQVKKWVHVCSKCNREIRGNGSHLEPYTCCGLWKYNFKTNEYEL